MKIILRIIGFPFFAALSLIGALALWLKYMWNYTKYGGEAISYTHDRNPKTIADIFHKISESQIK